MDVSGLAKPIRIFEVIIMAIASYAPKVKAEEASNGGWQMHLRQQAQGETQKWRDNNAPQADNGWGNTQARIDPYNPQAVNQTTTDQMKSVMATISPALQQQQNQQQAQLFAAADKGLQLQLSAKQLGINERADAGYGTMLLKAVDQRNNIETINAIPAAQMNAQANYENSVAGYNARQAAQYAIDKQSNMQYQAAAEAASAQRDSATAQAEAQKYVAQQAASANMAGALFGAVGNIASGFGGGRYW
jgi:hypothetical protein